MLVQQDRSRLVEQNAPMKRSVRHICMQEKSTCSAERSPRKPLPQMMISARMAMEARAKVEGAKFLKRDREQEEDKKFMARTAAGTGKT